MLLSPFHAPPAAAPNSWRSAMALASSKIWDLSSKLTVSRQDPEAHLGRQNFGWSCESCEEADTFLTFENPDDTDMISQVTCLLHWRSSNSYYFAHCDSRPMPREIRLRTELILWMIGPVVQEDFMNLSRGPWKRWNPHRRSVAFHSKWGLVYFLTLMRYI